MRVGRHIAFQVPPTSCPGESCAASEHSQSANLHFEGYFPILALALVHACETQQFHTPLYVQHHELFVPNLWRLV